MQNHNIIYQQKASTSTKYTSDSSIQAGSPVSDSDGDSYKEIEGVKPPISYLGLFLRIWREALVVLCVFFVTLSLFPSMTAEIETTSSISQAWFSILYVVSFLFFFYVILTLNLFLILILMLLYVVNFILIHILIYVLNPILCLFILNNLIIILIIFSYVFSFYVIEVLHIFFLSHFILSFSLTLTPNTVHLPSI